MEDLVAPDWLQLQHPCVRYLWDPTFYGYNRVAEPKITKAMNLDLPKWDLHQSAVDTIRRSIDDPLLFELFLKWIDSNYRSGNLGLGFYGGVEGACRAPISFPFESQLKYFLFHSLWVCSYPMVTKNLKETRSNPKVLTLAADDKNSSTLLQRSSFVSSGDGLQKTCSLGLLLYAPDGTRHHSTHLYQLLHNTQVPDQDQLRCLKFGAVEQLDRKAAEDLGIIMHTAPQSAINM